MSPRGYYCESCTSKQRDNKLHKPTFSGTQVLSRGREAGVCMHLTSLPGPFGIGEIGQHAREFIDDMNAMRLQVWQFLPTGPTAYGDSPYQALSTFAGNEMLIDIADLIEKQFITADEAADLLRLPRDHVDYATLIPVKMRILRLAAHRFLQNAGTDLQSAYGDFVTQHGQRWLHDYALYRILKSQHGEQPWPAWPSEYMHREAIAMRALEVSAAGEIEIIKVLQFLFHHQWQQLRAYANSKGIRLFGDVPIYIALDSADAWANPHLLRIDADGRPDRVAGVPPDYFSDDGQLWGNPLYAWDTHVAEGFGWWVERLRAATQLADIIRIDHFRGFESYWSVSADAATARDGSWEPGPRDAIFRALQGALGELPIIAEDLGVITPEVEALRDRQQIPGMTVLQFAVADPAFELQNIAENSVCYTGTHDNDTTMGWFRTSPEDVRAAALRLTNGNAATINNDLTRLALSSKARLAIATLQDYLGLGSEARFNTPGTTGNNWRWRYEDDQISPGLRQQVAGMVTGSGRAAGAN